MWITKHSVTGSAAAACNLAIETFLFISAFLGFHKCFLIMEVSGKVLTIGDILSLYARKFLRLAPAYYGLWLLEWAFTSRIAHGKLWHRTRPLYAACANGKWVRTALWVSNLSTGEESMAPWATCYQQAWPLQLDLQMYLLVPWIAMVFWKWPKLGMTVSTLLVLANMVINIVVADRYNLKIGWADVS